MVRDPDDAVAEGSALAPRMLRQPADAPPPLGPVGGIGVVASFRRVWTGRTVATRSSMRAWAGRISGRSDRRLLLAVAAATEAMAAHCDLLIDRVNAQEAVSADVAAALGQEIVQLRAEVVHLERSLVSLRDAPT
jgi:hypothetical protein